MNDKWKKVVIAVIPLVIAVLSIFVLTDYAASTEVHSGTLASLDDKKITVMELTAASTAASAAITLIPGDTATPIANKLVDFSSYFLLVLCAIYLEKYLVTITGYAAFSFLIPLACVLFSINVFLRRPELKNLAKKIVVFGLAIFLVVPISVKASSLIEETYSASIENTLEAARQTTLEIESSAESEEAAGLLEGIVSTVKDKAAALTVDLETTINNFIEALAVMLVTSCIIPILVLLFFFWLIKTVLGVNIKLPVKEKA